jgi:hypothetical protein
MEMAIVKVFIDDVEVQSQEVIVGDESNDHFSFIYRPAPGCHYLNPEIRIQVIKG